MSRLIAFWSPGGSGASTLLLNAATALGARRISLAAADLNLTNPSLALYADLLPYHNPQSACLTKLLPALAGGRLTLDEVMRSLLEAGHFALLPGALDVVGGSRLHEEDVRELLAVLSSRFDLVLVDVTRHLDSVACLPVLELANRICLAVGPEIASRFHTRRHILALRAMGWQRKTSLIYNRAGGTPEEQVAHDCGLPVAATVPALSILPGLTEAGRIAYALQLPLPPAVKFRQAIDQLATLIAREG